LTDDIMFSVPNWLMTLIKKSLSNFAVVQELRGWPQAYLQMAWC